jgi:hypothetical protein
LFWLHSYPEKSTVSRYQTFKQVEKSTGREPPQLRDRPPFSGVLNNAWEAYNSLTEYTFSEIESFMRLTGHDLQFWEVQAIVKLASFKEAKPIWPLK